MNKSAAAGSVQLFLAPTNGTRAKIALLDCVLCLSCPGMSTVVAGHQARFICTLPLAEAICRHVTAKLFWPLSEQQREIGQGRSSVHVFNCTCDDGGRVPSKALSTWPGTGPTLLDSEADTRLLVDPVSVYVVSLCLLSRRWGAAEEISISQISQCHTHRWIVQSGSILESNAELSNDWFMKVSILSVCCRFSQSKQWSQASKSAHSSIWVQ